jgi:peptidoglycan/xylan/chitin deacetylase (PgdA/CDA1 family)
LFSWNADDMAACEKSMDSEGLSFWPLSVHWLYKYWGRELKNRYWHAVVLFGVCFICTSINAAALPVLCYHRVGPEKASDSYQISVERFESQLQWLKKNGYQSVSLKDIPTGITRYAKPVMITFDDGYSNAWTNAGPVLKRLGFKAVYFVHPKYLGKPRRFSVSQLESMEAQGFEIGSHSQLHSNMAKPRKDENTVTYAQRLEQEASQSRKDLEKVLGHPVESFAYPYGAWNHRVERAVAQAGYRLAFTATMGVNRPDAPLLRLRRLLIHRSSTLKGFARALRTVPLQVQVDGLQDGDLLEAGTALSLTLTPKVVPGVKRPALRAWVGSQALGLTFTSGNFWKAELKAPSKPGFYLLKLSQGNADAPHEEWLFQVLPKSSVELVKNSIQAGGKRAEP